MSMPKPILTVNNFDAGMIDNNVAQAANGFIVGVGIDIHENPGYLRPSFTLAQESTTTALITAIDNFDGDGTDKLYGFDGARVYKRTSTTWSVDRTLSGTTALTDTPDMVKWNGKIWYATKTDIGMLTGTTYDDDYLTTVVSGVLPAQDAAWKPLKPFLDKLFIGDGRYISSLDTTSPTPVFTQLALTLPSGFRIRAMEVLHDRLYIACGGDSATTGDASKSVVFVWDGTSTLFEARIDVDCIGGIQALKNIDNILYCFTRNVAPPQPAGIDMMIYNGADFELVKTVPNGPGDTDSCRMYPNAVANFNNNLIFGTTRVGGGTSQLHGVWKFGQANRNFPRSLICENLVSDQTISDVTIGAIKVFGNQYFVSNKTGSTFRVDALSTTIGNSYSYIDSQVYEISDSQTKTLVKGVKVFAKPMPASTSVIVKYAVDGGSFSTLGTITSSNQGEILFGIFQTCYTIEIRLQLTSNNADMPEIYKISIY